MSTRRRTIGLRAAIAMLGAVLAVIAAQPHAGAQPQISARIDSVRAFFVSDAVGNDIYGALEQIRRDSTRQDGLQRFSRALAGATFDPVERFRITAAYLFAREFLTDSIHAQFRRLWASLPINPPVSEHDEVCAATATLLAADALGPSQQWQNGRSTAENRDDASDMLRSWIESTVREGQQEFDSPTYGALFITAMLLVDRFAADRVFAARAGVMASWLFADYFHEYLGGQFGGAHSREDMNSAMLPRFSEMSALAWLYIGDGAQIYSREQYIATLFSYKPHPILLELAAGKTKPFEAWEWKRSANRLRGDTARTRMVPKYTYCEPLFMVGHAGGGLLQPVEQRTWTAVWRSERQHTTLFTMHPYSEAGGLTDFLPHAPELALRSNAYRDPYFGTITKTVGGSPYEHIFQHKNTVIALYDIPDIRRFQALVGFMPDDAVSFDVDSIRTGWITINAGDVFLAYYPLRRATVRREQAGRRLFSREGRNGAVVQITARNVVGSYDEFRRRILRTLPDTSTFSADGVLRYRTIFNDRLECAIGGALKVNGAARESDPQLLFSSPWLESRRGSGTLLVRGARKNLVIEPLTGTMREE